MKKYIGLATAAVLFLAGCSEENGFQDPTTDGNEVAVNIKYERNVALASQTYSAEAVLSKEGKKTITSDLDIDDESIEGLIKDVPNGDDWKVEIFVKDENGHICFKGLDVIDLDGDKIDVHSNLFGTDKDGKIDVEKEIIIDSTIKDGDLSDAEIDELIDAIFEGSDAELKSLITIIKEVIAGKKLDKAEIVILKEMISDFVKIISDGDWQNDIIDEKNDWKDKDWDKGDWDHKDSCWIDKDSIDWDDKDSIDWDDKDSIDWDDKDSIDWDDKDSIDWDDKDSIDWDDKDSIDWDDKDSIDWDKDSIDWDKDSIDWDKDSIDWDKDSIDWDKDSIDMLLDQDAVDIIIYRIAEEMQISRDDLWVALEKSGFFQILWKKGDEEKVTAYVKEVALTLKKEKGEGSDKGDWDKKEEIIEDSLTTKK